MAILPRYKRLRRRDWKDPFSWFNWYKRANPEWLFSYRPGVDPRSQGATFARADASTCATYVDANGVVQTVAANVPRYQHYVSGSGPTLLLEGSRVNLLTYSSDISNAAWAKGGSVTVTETQADPAGGTTAELLTAVAAGDFVYQVPTFTGDGTKVMSVFLKAGTSTYTDLRIQDASVGPTDRHHIRVTWTAGVPALSTIAGAGTLFTPIALTGGWYRIAFSATGVVAANSTRCYIYPSRFVVDTGTTYVWGAQAENATFPSSYIPTTSASVTRAADACSWPFLPVPQAMTVYADYYNLGTFQTGSTNGVWAIGDSTNEAFFLFNNGSGAPSAFHRTASDVSSAAAATPAFAQRTEHRAAYGTDGSVTLGQSLASAAEVVAATSAANAYGTAFSAQTLRVNARSAGTEGFLALSSLKIARNVRDLYWLRNRPA